MSLPLRIREMAAELTGIEVTVRGRSETVAELARLLRPEVRFRRGEGEGPICGEVEIGLLEGRIRFSGKVEGFEVGLVLEMLKRVAGTTTLPDRLRDHLRQVDRPLTLRLWIREGCGYCVPAAALATEVVVASPHLSLEVLDAGMCPERARKDGVFAVPTLKVGGETLIGLPSPSEVVGAVLSAARGL